MIYYFSDGNRLSADDQKFISENVFKYHPDKQSKVSDQVDYIMVSWTSHVFPIKRQGHCMTMVQTMVFFSLN